MATVQTHIDPTGLRKRAAAENSVIENEEAVGNVEEKIVQKHWDIKNVSADLSIKPFDEATFESSKELFIKRAKHVQTTYSTDCDILFIIANKNLEKPDVLSFATSILEPLLLTPDSHSRIRDAIYSIAPDTTYHSETSFENSDSEFEKFTFVLIKQAIDLSSFEGIELLLVISQFNRDQPTSPFLQIFASPAFRPLVLEGSEGRKQIIEESTSVVVFAVGRQIYYNLFA
ncbi:hypothetical protein HK096_005278 [Nowakowskiella sp. JEL0078]|nr:hypothetical protein HK096_005278 [Nowakowskiella sp. JEL0078]